MAKFEWGVMDIHSTSAAAPVMLIMHTAKMEEICSLVAGIPAEIVITGVTSHIQGKFMVDFCAVDCHYNRIIVECGQHLDKVSRQAAIRSVEAWLCNLGMLSSPPNPADTQKLLHYHIFAAVNLPVSGEEFYLSSPIDPFAYLEKGEEIARSENGTVVCSPASGYAIMCPSTTNRLSPDEAVLFLASAEYCNEKATV